MRLGTPHPRQGLAVDPDVPFPGCFKVTLRRGAPASAVRIWLGRPIDPETGEEMEERGFRWQAMLNGVAHDLYALWPQCARTPISREEHDRIVERNRTMDPESPFYDARRPVDRLTAPMPF